MNTIQPRPHERLAEVWHKQENLRDGDASLGQRDVVRSVSGATRTWIDGSPVFESSDMAGTLTHPNSRDRMCLSAIVYLAVHLSRAAVLVTNPTRLPSLRQGCCGRRQGGTGQWAWCISSTCSSSLTDNMNFTSRGTLIVLQEEHPLTDGRAASPSVIYLLQDNSPTTVNLNTTGASFRSGRSLSGGINLQRAGAEGGGGEQGEGGE